MIDLNVWLIICRQEFWPAALDISIEPEKWATIPGNFEWSGLELPLLTVERIAAD